MPKGISNKRYTGEFKQKVVETMIHEKLSYVEVARQFDVSSDTRIVSWELKHEHKMSLLLDVAGLPRSTYYYYTKK